MLDIAKLLLKNILKDKNLKINQVIIEIINKFLYKNKNKLKAF